MTSIGCGPDVNPSSLQNCVTESSVTTLIIHAEGTTNAALPQEQGTQFINYIDHLIGEHGEDSN